MTNVLRDREFALGMILLWVLGHREYKTVSRESIGLADVIHVQAFRVADDGKEIGVCFLAKLLETLV